MTLDAYLPGHLVRALARAPDPDAVPRADVLDAALLFTDLSGFTALTEKLQRRGREGAEEITDVLRTVFRPVLGAVRRAGGSIVSFGGDAVFVLFEGSSCVRRAHAAASQIQQRFSGGVEVPTSAGEVTLQISQALHFGRVEGLHLGTLARRCYVVAGQAVGGLAEMEARAAPGELLVSPAAAAQEAREPPPPRALPRGESAPRARLEPYVPNHVIASAGHFRGEYRRAVLMFVETRGWSEALLQSFAQRLQRVLDRYEGILVGTDLSTDGTKWLCAFGAPVAHEDDPERAARSAIDLLAPLEDAGRGQRLSIRGGIHAGVVANIWVGAPWRRSYELIGDATNTAARAAAAARWGEIVATADVVASVSGLVSRARGRHRVKGKEKPVELRAVVGMRRPAASRPPMAPLLGRQREMELLQAALGAAARGRGRAIAIRAEAGLGKSRIKLEVGKLARAAGFDVVESRALAFGGGALQVALDLLRQKLGIGPRATLATVRSRIQRFASRHRIATKDRRRIEEALTGAAAPRAERRVDPETFRATRAVSLAAAVLATERPQLLVLEDLHWSDPASRELFARVVADVGASSTLVLLLHRAGFDPPDGAEQITLRELSTADVRRLLRAILGRPSPAVQEVVAARAGGNPFYVEEVARHLLESGVLERRGSALRVVRTPRADDLPPTVEAVIASRLSRLSPAASRLCQVGAVIGRTFPLQLVEQHPDLRGGAKEALAELARRELVFEIGDEDHRECIFKHAITRDVAYLSILVARRRQLHRWVAGALERLDDAMAGRTLAVQAHHWEEAGQVARARARYASAATQAADAHAHDDAIRLHRKQLALTKRAGTGDLEARVRLGHLLHLTGSFDEGRAELQGVVAAASSPARRLVRTDALTALGELELERNHPDAALPRFQAAVALARAFGDADREARALLGLGRVHIVSSHHEDAEAALARAGVLFDEAGDRGGSARVLARRAILRDAQGRAAEATPLLEASLAIHRETGDRAAQGEVLGFLGASWTHRGYDERGARYFRQALAIARELGPRRLEAMWSNNLGIATKASGQLEDAATHFQQAIRIFRAIGVQGYLGQTLGNLADVRASQARFDEADALVSQALTIHREIGDQRSEALTLGHLAELRQKEGRLEEAAIVNARAVALCARLRQVRMEQVALRRQLGLLRVLAPRGSRMDGALARSALLLTEHPSEILLKLVCERGHATLARGASARDEIALGATLLETLGIDDANEGAAMLRKLSRAQELFAQGEPLLHGMHPDDVGDSVRRWARAKA